MEETYTGISITLDPESLRRLDELVKLYHSNRSQATRVSINETYERNFMATVQEDSQWPTKP